MKPHTIELIRALVRQFRGNLAAIDMWITAEEAASKHLQTDQQYVNLETPDGSRRLGRAKKEKQLQPPRQ